MNKQQSVPRLDLAPKLRCPLSLWNPLDYLRLLYWILFFPQALVWYEDNFAGGFVLNEVINWQERWELLLANKIKLNWFIQAFILTIFGPIIINLFFQLIGTSINWYSWFFSFLVSAISAIYSLRFGVVFAVAYSVAFGIVFTVLSSLQIIILDWVSKLQINNLNSDENIKNFLVFLGIYIIALWLGTYIGLCVALSVGTNQIYIKAFEQEFKKLYAQISVLFLSLLSILSSLISIMANSSLNIFNLLLAILTTYILIVFYLVFYFGFLIIILTLICGFFILLRPESWICSALPNLILNNKNKYRIPHVSPIPIPSLSSLLINWLRRDWESGISNINHLFKYTLQFTPAIQALNRVLAETALEQVIFRIAQLAENPHSWRLIYSASASLWQTIILSETETRLDTPARATAAGFWYLRRKNPRRSAQAFERVRDLNYGEEMFILAQTIETFYNSKKIDSIAAISLPSLPKQPLLRSNTWEAIASFYRVIENLKIVERSASRPARSFALNRALGELKNIVNKRENLPQAERDLIVDIAENWQEIILRIAGQVGEISITKPVGNPYVIGDPVYGNLFVGREDIMRQLEELWVFRYQLQSVLIFGHRRMGKTSILLNAANCLESQVKVAYVNLLNVGNIPQGVGEVMMAISDAISEIVNLPTPSDADFINFPYPTFKRYLKQVEANLDVGLIIALDEFEKIEELIENGKIDRDFIGVLKGLVQMSPKIAFAFAGSHTLEEMTADYFQPFFASVIPIRVGFLERGATRQVLANPDEDFPLDYKREALDLIYDLTAGQPYLVQWVGFQLVRRYNDLVFEMGRTRDRVFTVEDVEEVVNDPEFFKRGRYYFDGVWGQTVQGISGQQTIIRSIAPYPEGLTINAIAQSTAIDEATIEEALNTLKRHDVVGETDGRWHIIVELFRRWVLDL